MSDDLRLRVLTLLRRKAGQRLSKSEIAAELKIKLGFLGAEYQNDCRLGFELMQLAEQGHISFAFPDAKRPEFNYWVEPPRRDETTGMELRP
jgi:hypothetical protein